jgi:DNA-damage-inducible protein J
MLLFALESASKSRKKRVLAAMGLTVSDAFRPLLTRVARDKALPFEPLAPNATTIKAMKDARAGKVTKTPDLAALFADLTEDV